MCHLAEVSRAGFYRRRRPAAVPPEELALRDAVQRVALEWPAYGSRRITRELQQRGWRVNRKRVQRIMREDNLLCLRHRRFVVTTDSNHDLPVYPNLAKSMVLTGINQLWRADITYMRLAEEFVYLAVMLDAYSRRVDRLGAGPHAAGPPDAHGLGNGADAAQGAGPAWCTIPIAGCSTPAGITLACSKSAASASACRAPAIPGTTPPASRS